MTATENPAGFPLSPGSKIGIVGGGQLGQMIALSAREMGFQVGVLDPDPHCPTAPIADKHVVASYDDSAALDELAGWADVLTYEFENVDADALDSVAHLVPIPQGTKLLRTSQDRRAEKEFFTSIGVPVARWEKVEGGADLEQAVSHIGYPCVLKSARGGYDGKGQVVLRSPADLPEAEALADRQPCVLEELVEFESEISAIVSGGSGSFVVFPLVQNEHRSGILHQSVMPAPVADATAKAATDIARKIATELDLAGTLAIEMFVCKEGGVLVNEMAPRPHNSGHATIEACDFSQFDLHVRGICGWPLPQPRLLEPAVMVNVLGEHLEGATRFALDDPQWHFHLYGKQEVRDGRKTGHLTALGAPDARISQTEGSGVWS